jgi:hypothetical protein
MSGEDTLDSADHFAEVDDPWVEYLVEHSGPWIELFLFDKMRNLIYTEL